MNEYKVNLRTQDEIMGCDLTIMVDEKKIEGLDVSAILAGTDSHIWDYFNKGDWYVNYVERVII